VPKMFYEKVVAPTFTGTDGIVYILPELRSAREVFNTYVVGERRVRHAQSSLPGSVAR